MHEKKNEVEVYIFLAGMFLILIVVIFAIFSNGYASDSARKGMKKKVASHLIAAYQNNVSVVADAGTPFPGKTASISIVEGHWQGIEVISITDRIRRSYKIDNDITGVLVDEVTLGAVDTELKAGDIIEGINDIAIKTLDDFKEATYRLRDAVEVKLRVIRSNKRADIMIRDKRALGMAQMESAPAIPAGSVAPHAYRGYCTGCHLVQKGLHLNPAPWDMILPPSPIQVGSKQPHRDRGVCSACHKIV